MRLGIIGCGLIGHKRAASARDQTIAIVCDAVKARAEPLGAQTGATVTTDWREVVEADLDIILVATPHESLSEIATAAAENGKHVLVEKPAGRTLKEVTAIVEAARGSGRIVKVGFNLRFHPGPRKAREIVDGGSLGPLLYVRGRYGHGGRPGYEKEWRCEPERSGGGELIDQGSHLIDLARWFLDDLSLDYAATPTYFWDTPVDDNCFLALRGGNGTMAWLHASWTEWKNLFSFEITGRDGKLVIDGLGGSYGVERLTLYRMLPEMGPPETTIWEFPFPDRSWEIEFTEFIAAIEAGRRPIGDIDDAVALHTIIRDAYAMQTKGGS